MPSRKPTNIEREMAALLTEMGLKFRREYKHGNYPVDFYLPAYHLSVQADGAYHHGPCIYCKEKGQRRTPRQLFQSRRDKACIAYHRYSKINIVRFCECMILGNRERIRQILIERIQRILNGEAVYDDRKDV